MTRVKPLLDTKEVIHRNSIEQIDKFLGFVECQSKLFSVIFVKIISLVGFGFSQTFGKEYKEINETGSRVEEDKQSKVCFETVPNQNNGEQSTMKKKETAPGHNQDCVTESRLLPSQHAGDDEQCNG